MLESAKNKFYQQDMLSQSISAKGLKVLRLNGNDQSTGCLKKMLFLGKMAITSFKFDKFRILGFNGPSGPFNPRPYG